MKIDILKGIRYCAVTGLLAFWCFSSVWATDIGSKIKITGEPTLGGNGFYGYRNSSEGPGVEAFRKVLNMAISQGRPMMLIYCADGCDTCDKFATMVNASSRTLAISGPINGYFKGNAQASKEAYEFFNKGSASDPNSEGLKSAGGAKAAHHIIGFYGVAEDGSKYKYSGTLRCTGDTFQDCTWLNKLKSDQYSAWVSFRDAHKMTAAAEFAVKNTAGDRLEATEKTADVAVPLVRNAKTETAESDTFITTYPDGTAVTNALNWAAGDTTRTITVEVTGKWQEGKVVKLEIRDSNGTVFRKSEIHCVKAVNSFEFPDLVFDPEGEWGRWTLDSEENWAAAIEKAYVANSYQQADTNDNPEVEQIVMSIPISPSNRYDVVYTNDIAYFADSKVVVPISHKFAFVVSNRVTTVWTNDLAAFEKAKDDEESEAYETVLPNAKRTVTHYVTPEELGGLTPADDPASEMAVDVEVTNFVYGVEQADDPAPVEWLWARAPETKSVMAFTNRNEYAETNAEHLVGTASTNWTDLVVAAKGLKRYFLNKTILTNSVDVAVSEDYRSACVYALVPRQDASVVTNLYGWTEATYENSVAVTNAITVLPIDAEHTEPAAETKPLADDPSPVKREFEQEDEVTYHTVVSNWLEVVDQPYVCFGTNRTFYVELPGCVTNEDASARTLVQDEGLVPATNYVEVVLTNAMHELSGVETTYTNFTTIIDVECTNFYYSVATNAYQHGALGRAEGGRDEGDTQVFVLKVTGSAVWQPETVAFAANVLNQSEFADWCASNRVVTLLEECSDPETGASLFSRTVAANGRSGAAFLSRNELEPGCVQPPASNVFEVTLYRPDGTLAGVLAPQRSAKGEYDLDENIFRLQELLTLADDLTELANDDPATTTLEAVYGQTVMTEPAAPIYGLDINDKRDVFKLVDVPADEFVSVSAVSKPATRQDGHEKPQVTVWRYADKTKASMQMVAPVSADADGNPVWKFAEADLRDGDVDLLYADVTVWTNESAATGIFNGLTRFDYPLTVTAAPDFFGEISFAETNKTYDAEPDEAQVVELKVSRTGYTGGASVTLKLECNEIPADRIVWTHDGNNATNLVWEAGEAGTKTVRVTVNDVSWEDSVSNMVFTLSQCEGPALAEDRRTCVVGIQQEDDENAKTGVIYISNPKSTGEKIWAKCSSDWIEITVNRDRVWNELSGKNEARGEATANLFVTGGALLETNALYWLKGEKTGPRTARLKMTDVGASGQQTVAFTVTGTDVDGNAIHSDDCHTLTYVFVPEGAPEFAYPEVPTAYQYVSYEAKALLQDYYPAIARISELTLLEGALPEGLTAEIIDEDEDLGGGSCRGGIRITGKSTKVCSAKLVYQLTLTSGGAKKSRLVKTIPVTFAFDVKPLGGESGSSSCGAGVIPGFAEHRVWQYLPLTNDEGRVVGLLNLSASPKGSVSARYTTQGKTVAFAKSALDLVREDEDFGGYVAEAEMEKADFNLKVQFGTNNRVIAELMTPEDEKLAFASDKGIVTWKQREDRASAWKGRYTVAFPVKGELGLENARGTAALVIAMTSSSMTANGAVRYTGVLPNGKPINGTSMLLPTPLDADSAKLPIYWSSATDAFSAVLVISKGGGRTIAADPSVTSYWRSGGLGHDLSIIGAGFDPQAWAELRPSDSLMLNRTTGLVSGPNLRGVAVTDRDGKKWIMGTAWSTVDDGQGGAMRKAEAVESEPVNEVK